jgi:non-heme chloroperoxidase
VRHQGRSIVSQARHPGSDDAVLPTRRPVKVTARAPRYMNHFTWLALMASALAGRVTAQDTCPAPNGRLLTVAPDVRLEVIEWGGAGEPLLFLSGMGGTAHAFDHFAPNFADRYRVAGMTRRGWGRSSRSPGYEYGSAVLVGDIVAVMDSLAMPAAHVVGSSFGGNEATLVAVQHPERVLSVTLLDSYDNSLAAGTFAGSDSLPSPTGSTPPGPPANLREMIDRDRALGGRQPVTELCATSRFAPDGRYLGPVSSDSVGGYTLFGAMRLAYSAVTQPVLAIFGTMRDVGDMFPEITTMDSADRARANVLAETVHREIDAGRLRLRRAVPSAHIVEISGADHAIFRSHPDLVIRTMRAFFAGIGDGTWVTTPSH